MVGVEEITFGILTEGDWILVKLSSLRSNNFRHFLGQLLTIYGNADFTVKFVKQYRYENYHIFNNNNNNNDLY